ncbi:MAG: MaoC/PaaZ C-terminal domain-containing protein [Alphaproteobacteria bacterium]
MTDQAFSDIAIGGRIEFTKTVTADDIERFAELTGDFDPLHLDEDFCKTTPYGARIAHGALIIGYMSSASSMMTGNIDRAVASLGYDRIRLVAPVFIGDTVTTTYEIVATDPERNRATAKITVTNQHGETVAVADHIMKVL